MASTILNWGHRRLMPEIDDNALQKNAWISVGITPYFMNPRWTETPNFWFSKRLDKNLEIINGTGIINAKLPQGLQYIQFIYEDLLSYKLSKMISAGLFSVMLLLLIMYKPLTLHIKKKLWF